MNFFDLYRYFLILIVPGFIGALAFSLSARCRTEISVKVALIIDLLTFIVMITRLYFFLGIVTVADLIAEFNSLLFTRNYALLSIAFAIIIGTIIGFIRRLFFWIRR